MEALQEEHEHDLYIAEFSRNVSLPNNSDDDDNVNEGNDNNIEETEENFRGRGRRIQ